MIVSMLNTGYVTCKFAIIQPKKHLNGCQILELSYDDVSFMKE